MDAKYKRCLLKISGESLAGPAGSGFDAETINAIAAQVAEISRLGVQLGLVVGGGNIWRGLPAAEKSLMDRCTADSMGMLATVMNSLYLRSAIEACGVPCRVESAIPMEPVAPGCDLRRSVDFLEQGGVVVFAAGSGHPFFSTDTAAALRAAEIRADVILMAKKVDGVYTADPKTDPTARRIPRLTMLDVVQRELRVMDLPAAAMCRDNRIPIVVFKIDEPGNMLKAVMGEDIGTTVEV
ncbi:MAG: UMP kinase [Firmicutes bacterium]|nr:UMP kinase [Bacillota bacterium]